jgi:hypothetical protein
MWFWLRRPKLAPHDRAMLIVWTLCVLVCLTIALADWPFISMPERAAELFLLLIEVAVAIWAMGCRLRFLRWRREYEPSLHRLIRTILPAL